MRNENFDPHLQSNEADIDAENTFIEQAEYIAEKDFLAWSADHPQEEAIIRRLAAGGAKLLIGPRGCGKTTLLLKSYHTMLGGGQSAAFPVYVNFKLSLRLEPLYINTPNATFWFSKWLVAKIYDGIHSTLEHMQNLTVGKNLPSLDSIESFINDLEAGKIKNSADDYFTLSALSAAISQVTSQVGRQRCVLLFDDAAHAFSPKQQEDFFDFFRQIKSREIAPKAAIYPGVTTHSANFHVGHDAEQIDAWMKPDTAEYLVFMQALASKRFSKDKLSILSNKGDLDFLAYAAFGVPRSFINMIRYLLSDSKGKNNAIERKRLLDAVKISREAAHSVYDSLATKLPSYKKFVENGDIIYSSMLNMIKEYNKDREENNQALEIGIRRPVPLELSKVFSFFQYAGLLMPVGENSRGVKGTFDLYMLHFGDLITENAIIGKRTKSVQSFMTAFASQTHQVWPRVNGEKLALTAKGEGSFSLILPSCQNCGAPRLNQDARFCHNCGSQLKNTSLYEELINQDISCLPITKTRVSNIKSKSSIRTVKDILIDSSKQELRGVPYIGPVWAERITRYAEEHVA